MNLNVTKAVITAAGFGSRFLPVVKNIPKEMLPIVDKPILEYVVEECIEAGIQEIIIVVRKGNHVVKDYFTKPADEIKELLDKQGKSERFAEVERVLSFKGIKIIEQIPELPYGNGSPVLSAKPYLCEDEAFALLWADDLVLTNGEGALKQLVDFFAGHECDGVTAVQHMAKEELSRYGILKPRLKINESEGVLDSIVEKPASFEGLSDLASYGRMIIPYKVFDYLTADATGKDGELWLQDANAKVAQNGTFMYKVVDGDWLTTGDPSRYFEAQTRFMLNDERYAAGVKKFLGTIN